MPVNKLQPIRTRSGVLCVRAICRRLLMIGTSGLSARNGPHSHAGRYRRIEDRARNPKDEKHELVHIRQVAKKHIECAYDEREPSRHEQ